MQNQTIRDIFILSSLGLALILTLILGFVLMNEGKDDEEKTQQNINANNIYSSVDNNVRLFLS